MSEDKKRQEMKEFIEHFVKNEEGVRVLLMIWDGIQAWDDAYDGDTNSKMVAAMRYAFVDLPSSPLYLPANIRLQIQQMFLKWHVANVIEESGLKDQLHKSYMLRAEFYQLIVNMVCFFDGLEVALAKAPDIWVCYGEVYEDYEKEICQTLHSELEQP